MRSPRGGSSMFKCRVAFVAIGLLSIVALAKDKKKQILSPSVLSARTVTVLIDPSAGVSFNDPRANEVAQKDVETALLNWGRYDPILGAQAADLIIVVRKGTGHVIDETIPDARQNNRAGAINPMDNGVGIGAQRGPQPDLSGRPGSGSNQGPMAPQTEISSSTGDTFLVYDGTIPHPLDSSPVWRYMGQDGLQPHSVPAVAAFKKAVADAEKAAGKKP